MQNGRILLHQASQNGRKEIVEFLLDRGAEVDKEDEVKYNHAVYIPIARNIDWN